MSAKINKSSNLKLSSEESIINPLNQSKLYKASKVDQIPSEMVAQQILTQMNQTFGKGAVELAFQHLHIENEELPAKIDTLFHAAKEKDSSTIQANNPYHLDQLTNFMNPFVELRSLSIIWSDLMEGKIGRFSLRRKMVGIDLSNDPLARRVKMQNFLEENVDELAVIKKYDLKKRGLLSLPKEIGLFTNLTDLDLSDNQLRTLPAEIGNLSSLQSLKIENNLLQELPETMGKLVNLQYLYLYNNQISSFPAKIAGMQSLQVLSATKNQLTHLPDDIGNINQLQILALDYNHLKNLPDTIVNLKNLDELHVNNNKIKQLPGLPTLKHLGCEGNLMTPSKGGAAGIEKGEFKQVYHLLGNEKWKECIDGMFHNLGPDVFDLGLHGGAIEPGFRTSMENVFKFLPNNYHRRVDASFYLELHKVACSHFKGAITQTLIGQDKIGVFRKEGVTCNFAAPHYTMSDEAIKEFNAVNLRLAHVFGSSFSLGEIVLYSDSPRAWNILYDPMTPEQVTIVFNLFLNEFHVEMEKTTSLDDKLTAIAKLIQHLEWLHPAKDGNTRTNIALLNFLLTKYGLNPALLQYPHIASCRDLAEWTLWIKKGLDEWQRAVPANSPKASDNP